jgi:hypothetical protein
MAYTIKPYSFAQAKKLGVIIKPSKNPIKKLDVFNSVGKKLASVGAIGYKDYPSFMELEKRGKVAKGTAAKRRALYKIRHEKDRKIINSPGYFADKLLW